MCCLWPLAVIYLIIFFPVQLQYESEAGKELTRKKKIHCHFFWLGQDLQPLKSICISCVHHRIVLTKAKSQLCLSMCIVMLHISSLLISFDLPNTSACQWKGICFITIKAILMNRAALSMSKTSRLSGSGASLTLLTGGWSQLLLWC